jgi:hypothetical protein
MALKEGFADRAQSQRRGRPGFAPDSLFVGSKNQAADHQRTSNSANLTSEFAAVKSHATHLVK